MDSGTVITFLLLSIFAFALLGFVLVKVLSGQLALQIWYFVLGLWSTILTIAFYVVYAAIVALLAASDPDSHQSLLEIFAVLLRDSNQENLAECVEGLRQLPEGLQKFLVGCLLTLGWLSAIYPMVSFVRSLRNGVRNGNTLETMQMHLGAVSADLDVTHRKIDVLHQDMQSIAQSLSIKR